VLTPAPPAQEHEGHERKLAAVATLLAGGMTELGDVRELVQLDE
jgi:hypothetical protein